MATPMLETSRRWGSRVEFSATTAKTTSPGERYLRPSLRVICLHCGGKIEDTRTRFWAATPASRRASSKDVNRSLCLPTPLVKNRRFGTMFLPNVPPSQTNLTQTCNRCGNAPARWKKMHNSREMAYSIKVEYAEARKIRERNTTRYRMAHLPIWIWVFFLSPGPLTFDLFAHGGSVRNVLWLLLVIAGVAVAGYFGQLPGSEPRPYILRFTEDRPNPLYRKICYTFA